MEQILTVSFLDLLGRPFGCSPVEGLVNHVQVTAYCENEEELLTHPLSMT